MPPESKPGKQRRSERVLIRIPVRVSGVAEDGTAVNEDAHAVIVSAHGALMQCKHPFKLGSDVTVLNGFSQEEEKFRVVWHAEKAKDERYDVGMEFVKPRPDFWGINFPPPAGAG